jgi:hypothetical protein
VATFPLLTRSTVGDLRHTVSPSTLVAARFLDCLIALPVSAQGKDPGKGLSDTAGAGQDAELFNFATDADSGQRAEIRIMETMLAEKP